MFENGIRPVYVFDGKPPEIKKGELYERAEKKKQAEAELQAAVEAGDSEAIKKAAVSTLHRLPSKPVICQREGRAPLALSYPIHMLFTVSTATLFAPCARLVLSRGRKK
eukprot:SAG31_NODE_91_length_26366_cov_6.792211_2_plen_109_part_00